MRVPCTLAVLAAAFLLVGNATPSSLQQAPRDSQPLTTQATAIVVDVVVRDKQGRPVVDLAASDFELYEDDVRQTIGNLALVAPGRADTAGPDAAGNATTAAQTPRPVDRAASSESPTSVGKPTFVALVFDRLSPESRALAHKGALAYLESARPDDFAGVFLIDLDIETIQTYTNDRARVQRAIDEAASRATTTFNRNANRVYPTAFGDRHPATSPTTSAEEHGPPDPQTRQAMTDEVRKDTITGRILRMAERMERSYEAMVRDEQGFATTNGLLALIDALGVLPGRKTVVFFADGLAIPPNVQVRFDSVVATANRANVSVYTVDSAGLRVHSKGAEAARQINALGELGLDERLRDPKVAWTTSLELNEDILKQDPVASLGILANRTGGFLINNTNDLERGFRTIDSDRRFHYLLTYTPANTDFRGEWRRIAVKVPRRDVTVRARSGYVAVRAPGALPLLSYEGPALAALERSPLPNDLPVRAGAFVFPHPKTQPRVAVLVAISGSALTFETASAKQTYRTDFTVLTRIKDATGEVVRKGSQPYRLTGPAAQVEQARRGNILFFRRPELGAGSYTLEYVVDDALAKRAGAGSMPLVVPDARKALQVSSLVIVQRAERVPPNERGEGNPLYYGDLLLYPNLGEPLSKSAAKAVPFYFTIVPAPGAPSPTALLELVQGVTVIGRIPLQLTSPGPDGGIQHVSQVPLEKIPPGDYQLRVTVTQGAAVETRTAAFRVVE